MTQASGPAGTLAMTCEHSQAEYELREARAEISRHHKLIAEMRDLLECLIDEDDCHFDSHGGCQTHMFLSLEPGEICPNEQAKRLLNRRVS